MKTLSPKDTVKQAYLRRIPLFEALEEGPLSTLARQVILYSTENNELLFRASDPAKTLFMLIQGSVEIFLELPTGERRVLHLIEAPSLLAQAALFSGGTWPANARTLTEGLVLTVGREAIIALTRDYPELPWRLMGGMYKRLNEFKGIIEKLSLKSAQARVAIYLLGAAPDCPQVVLPAPKNKIANYLGLRPETFSRALKSLNARGALRVTPDGIMILNRDILTKALEE